LEGSRLHPIAEPDGTHVFDVEEVQALARERQNSRGPTAGELAARACELFREGKGAIDVIIALRQPFDVVREWQRSYVAESETLFVPEPLAHEMKERFFVEEEPFTPEGLYLLLERLASRNLELSRRMRVLAPLVVQGAAAATRLTGGANTPEQLGECQREPSVE
jgi:hypothetical protein